MRLDIPNARNLLYAANDWSLGKKVQEKDRRKPFSAAAQEAGIPYYGGKLGDITIVVSHVIASKNVRPLLPVFNTHTL